MKYKSQITVMIWALRYGHICMKGALKGSPWKELSKSSLERCHSQVSTLGKYNSNLTTASKWCRQWLGYQWSQQKQSGLSRHNAPSLLIEKGVFKCIAKMLSVTCLWELKHLPAGLVCPCTCHPAEANYKYSLCSEDRTWLQQWEFFSETGL